HRNSSARAVVAGRWAGSARRRGPPRWPWMGRGGAARRRGDLRMRARGTRRVGEARGRLHRPARRVRGPRWRRRASFARTARGSGREGRRSRRSRRRTRAHSGGPRGGSRGGTARRRRGPTARIHADAGWRSACAEEMSALSAKRVLVTRAAEDQEELAALLRAQGAEPVALPCIEFAEPIDAKPLETALRKVRSGSPPDFLVLASPHAADRFLARVEPAHLRSVRIAAAGSGTARRIEERGLVAEAPAKGAGAEALLELLAPHVRGRDVLLPRAEGGNPALLEGLERAGAKVSAVTLYRTVPAVSVAPKAAGLLRAGSIDAIAFASGTAARG